MTRFTKALFILCIVLVCPGCITIIDATKKCNPFTKENHFDTVFGYPPKVIAKFLDIEDQLTVDPEDLNKARPKRD